MTARWTDQDSLPAGVRVTSSRPAGPPITVEQVVDVDAYSVQVRLDPESLIKVLADTLIGHHGALVLVAHLSTDNPEHIRARAELVNLLAETFTVTLSPGAAAVVEQQLFYACDEPNRCFYDENFATVVVDGLNLCNDHALAKDQVEQATS